jgi:hypothetical protein
MDSSKIRPLRARKIFGLLRPATGYLQPPETPEVNDPFYVEAAKPLEAMRDLLMKLHRLSSESAVWMEPRLPEE